MIIKKIMVFLLVFCILIVVREIGTGINKFIHSDFSSLPGFRIVSLGLAISYIMTIILTGFSLT